MSASFDPTAPHVVVVGYATGIVETLQVRFAVDTGATGTVISATILAALGLAATPTSPRRRLRGVTGTATVPVVRVRQLLALGSAQTDFPVAAHDLPLGTSYDGLLGLDFFRGRVLRFDFARGRVALRPPRRWWRFWR